MMTIIPKPSRTSQDIIAQMVKRAKDIHGIAQKEIGLNLADKAYNVVSHWKKEGMKGIPIDQIIPFAAITRMSNDETVDLIVTRLDEENGNQVTIDVQALIKVIYFVAEPAPDEVVMRKALNDEKTRINWRHDIFDKPANVNRMNDCLTAIIQSDAHESCEESNPEPRCA